MSPRWRGALALLLALAALAGLALQQSVAYVRERDGLQKEIDFAEVQARQGREASRRLQELKAAIEQLDRDILLVRDIVPASPTVVASLDGFRSRAAGCGVHVAILDIGPVTWKDGMGTIELGALLEGDAEAVLSLLDPRASRRPHVWEGRQVSPGRFEGKIRLFWVPSEEMGARAAEAEPGLGGMRRDAGFLLWPFAPKIGALRTILAALEADRDSCREALHLVAVLEEKKRLLNILFAYVPTLKEEQEASYRAFQETLAGAPGREGGRGNP